jgi:NCAIR mutase (PurE)-related protein
LAMLNSCAAGIAVVNIDNGFGAGYMAHSINLIGEPVPGSASETVQDH